jgi:hypothetical protein
MKNCILLFTYFMMPLLLLNCNGPPTPTMETATKTPTATDTPWPSTPTTPPEPTESPVPTDTPEPTATNTPTPFPTPAVDNHLVADFQTCFKMSGVSPGDAPENFLDFDCLPGAGRGNFIAQLEYEVPTAWAGFRIDLENADFSTYDTLTFLARGNADAGILAVFRLEIKRADGTEVAIYNLADLSEEWEQYVIPLQEFRPVPHFLPICGWNDMEELVFVFEKGLANDKGGLFLDNIYMESREGQAPEVPVSCMPATPVAPVPALMVADFCSGTNNLGGAMGAAHEGSNSLTESYGSHAGRDCAARLEYDIETWAAFWMKLQGRDLTPYSRLLFDIRGDVEAGVLGRIKIELKRANNTEVSIAYISNITDSWRTVSVSLDSFRSTGFPGVPPLSSLTGMEQLVFTFEADSSGNRGVVYLDQVRFQP